MRRPAPGDHVRVVGAAHLDVMAGYESAAAHRPDEAAVTHPAVGHPTLRRERVEKAVRLNAAAIAAFDAASAVAGSVAPALAGTASVPALLASAASAVLSSPDAARR